MRARYHATLIFCIRCHTTPTILLPTRAYESLSITAMPCNALFVLLFPLQCNSDSPLVNYHRSSLEYWASGALPPASWEIDYWASGALSPASWEIDSWASGAFRRFNFGRAGHCHQLHWVRLQPPAFSLVGSVGLGGARWGSAGLSWRS